MLKQFGIPPGVPSVLFSEILSGSPQKILSGISTEISSGTFAGISSEFFLGITSEIPRDFFSGTPAEALFPILQSVEIFQRFFSGNFS